MQGKAAWCMRYIQWDYKYKLSSPLQGRRLGANLLLSQLPAGVVGRAVVEALWVWAGGRVSASVVILTNEFCDILKSFFFWQRLWCGCLFFRKLVKRERLMGKSAYGNEQTCNWFISQNRFALVIQSVTQVQNFKLGENYSKIRLPGA